MAFYSGRSKNWVFASCGIVAAFLVLGFFLFAAFATRTVQDDSKRADAIVVLTGGSQRIAEAGRLLRLGRAGRLLISGVNRKTSKAAVMRLTKLQPDLFKCCVTLGYGAQNTRGNATETRDWQRTNKFSSLIVVTAAYHMPRSFAELSRRMPDVKLIPHPVVPKSFKAEPWWLHPTNARILASEYVKFLPSAAHFVVSRALSTEAGTLGRQQSYHAGARP